MSTFLSVLIFVAIGALIGVLFSRLFEGTSLVVGILLGLAGSFGFSWLASLLGLGSGFLTISVWGVVFGVVGACLLTVIYGFIAQRASKRTT